MLQHCSVVQKLKPSEAAGFADVLDSNITLLLELMLSLFHLPHPVQSEDTFRAKSGGLHGNRSAQKPSDGSNSCCLAVEGLCERRMLCVKINVQ